MRLLIFLGCLVAGVGTLLWMADGWRGRGDDRSVPEVPRQDAPVEGARVPLVGATSASGSLRLKDVGAPRYAMPEALTFRDPRSGERVDIPHFLPWAFSARRARALLGEGADSGSILFEDVVVLTYREPQTLEEARRLRDDPRAIEDFVHLQLFAPRARADGIARALETENETGRRAGDAVIVLDGGVEAHDRTLAIQARGDALTFDPRTHATVGQGPFTVEHAAWTLEGEGFTLARDAREGRARRDDAFRIEIARSVLLTLRQNVLDTRGATLWREDEFRPARVFAGRAAVVHDAAVEGDTLHIVLEQGVRALQQGGRRLLCDRLALTLEPSTRGGAMASRDWRLSHLAGEGRPLTLEVPDLETPGATSAARITARRLRHEPSPFGPPTTVLEGEPVVLLEGDLALAGVPGPGRWIRASAADRALLLPAPGVAVGPDGTPIVGRRLELRGQARLERRAEGAGEAGDFQDVLEGDEISLLLRPAQEGGPAREIPVSFAALGHVRLSGTRFEGATERIVVERLDTTEPLLIVEGVGTRLALLGFGRGQRLFGADPPSESPASEGPSPEGAGPEVASTGEPVRRAWTLERLEADGHLAGETRMGGPTVGVPAWVAGRRISYERVADRALLSGEAGAPASIHVEADATQRHALTAPHIAFERGRGRLRAEGGVRAEVFLSDGAPAGLTAGSPGFGRGVGRLRRLELVTDGRIEMQLRVLRPGGEPAPEAPQTLRVLAPFTAELRAPPPEAVDRLRADRLEVVFALRAPVERASTSSGLARPARPTPRGSSAADPVAARRSTPPDRWVLTSRTLVLDLDGGTLGGLEADGGVLLDGDALHVEGATLRFVRALGSLWLEGGTEPVRVRMGKALSESRLVARAVRVALDENGPTWVLASGPVQAVLVQSDAKRPGRADRYEVDCPGNVRLTDSELVADTPTTWVRRSERHAPDAPWGATSDVWADRFTIGGSGLLALGGQAGAGGVRTLTATGPNTTFRSGEGARRVDMWCERIEVDVPAGRAVLSGKPGRDVLVHFESGYDVELMRASFDFRTGEVEDLEAGRAILRRER